MRVRDIMSTPTIAVTPDATLGEAATVMTENGFTALPVIDSAGRLLGTVTEADVVYAHDLDDPRACSDPDTGVMLGVRGRTVGEAMTHGPDWTVTGDSEVSDVKRP
jgi:CBS domain-containing protein